MLEGATEDGEHYGVGGRDIEGASAELAYLAVFEDLVEHAG